MASYSPWVAKSHTTEQLSTHAYTCVSIYIWGFHGGSDGKESACNAGDLGSILGLGRSPGEGYIDIDIDIDDRTLFTHNKKKILPFVTTWMKA